MSKGKLWALAILTLSALVLIFNTRQRVEVNLLIESIKPMAALVYLAFIGVGVAIGMLLK